MEHDGLPVRALEGESLALALLAAGRSTLARSAKYHRPRGPACLHGVCDGCLVRVDGVPNVMACRTEVRSGMRVTSQNAFPSAGVDVLGVTDWFFPGHLDHHHLMVGLGPAVNRTMQVIARRMAGMGTLPDAAVDVTPARTIHADVLVVGAGPSGIALANALVRMGVDVLVVDEEPCPGGALLDDPAAEMTEALQPTVRYLPRTTAVATFDTGTVVQDSAGISVALARARVFANGAHALIGSFLQNDLPGVFTVRAFARALCNGVLLGERVAVVGPGALADHAAEAARAAGCHVTRVPNGTVREARGARAVRGVLVTEPAGERTVSCDVLAVAGEVSSYELAGQAGAALGWDPAGACFIPISDRDGATQAPGVYVTGRVRGGTQSAMDRATAAVALAARIVSDLGGLGGMR